MEHAITIKLSSRDTCLPEVEFHRWVEWVADNNPYTDDVDAHPYGCLEGDTIVADCDELTSEIRHWLSRDGWDAFCASNALTVTQPHSATEIIAIAALFGWYHDALAADHHVSEYTHGWRDLELVCSAIGLPCLDTQWARHGVWIHSLGTYATPEVTCVVATGSEELSLADARKAFSHLPIHMDSSRALTLAHLARMVVGS